jgi:hypothetical protein
MKMREGIKKVREDITLLRELSGFKKLNPRQRKIIETSLIVQERADRIKTGNTLDQIFKYSTSALFASDYNCHLSVQSVETGKIGKLIKHIIPAISEIEGDKYVEDRNIDFSEFRVNFSECKEFENFEKLTTFLDDNIPAIVHMFVEDGPVHSLIVLESVQETGANGFIIWEKVGYGHTSPFQITGLSKRSTFEDSFHFKAKKL